MLLLPIIAYGISIIGAVILHWVSYFIGLVFGFPVTAAIRFATGNMDSQTFDSVFIRFTTNIIESFLVTAFSIMVFHFFLQYTPVMLFAFLFLTKLFLIYISWKKTEIAGNYLVEDLTFMLVYGGMFACYILVFFLKNITLAAWAPNI